MRQKLNLWVALAACVLVGVISSTLTSVFAQTSEFRAQSFVLVDGRNNVIGRLTFDHSQVPPNPPAVVLLDADGQEIWRAGASIHPLGTR
jgi:hypothetical protein